MAVENIGHVTGGVTVLISCGTNFAFNLILETRWLWEQGRKKIGKARRSMLVRKEIVKIPH